MQLARAQGARVWELRATMDLAQLAKKPRNEGPAMLADIYGWFTEGFDIIDL